MARRRGGFSPLKVSAMAQQRPWLAWAAYEISARGDGWKRFRRCRVARAVAGWARRMRGERRFVHQPGTRMAPAVKSRLPHAGAVVRPGRPAAGRTGSGQKSGPGCCPAGCWPRWLEWRPCCWPWRTLRPGPAPSSVARRWCRFQSAGPGRRHAPSSAPATPGGPRPPKQPGTQPATAPSGAAVQRRDAGLSGLAAWLESGPKERAGGCVMRLIFWACCRAWCDPSQRVYRRGR